MIPSTEQILLTLHVLVLASLLVLLGVTLLNLRTFPRARREDIPTMMPRVSVLVPARNEEQSIAACVSSLLHQTYPNMEVIVLDDDSTDRTPDILQRLQARNPLLRLLNGKPLPSGWMGKNWACHQLAEDAEGDVLIFTDADTVHRPESIASLVAMGEDRLLGLWSVVPLERMETFWERLVIPIIQLLFMAHLPNRAITESKSPRFSAANGQVLCVTRSAYGRIGGHEAVRNNIVEDIFIARRAKEVGVRTALGIARDIIECRMYTSRREVFEGFTKNFFPALSQSVTLLLAFVVGFLLLYVTPWVFAIERLVAGDTGLLFWLPAAQVGTGLTVRVLCDRFFGNCTYYSWLHPVSVLAMIAIALNSAFRVISGRGVTWKSRTYIADSRADGNNSGGG